MIIMSLVDEIRLGNPTVSKAVNNTNFWGTAVWILLYRLLKEVLRYKSKYFHEYPSRRYLATSTNITLCVKSIQGILMWVGLGRIIVFISPFQSSASIGFRSRVIKYLGQRILPGHKEKSTSPFTMALERKGDLFKFLLSY